MKLILLLLILFSINVIKYDEFKGDVHNSYAEYIFTEYNKEDYIFSVVEGKCNDHYCYGLFLDSNNDDYYLEVVINDIHYNIRNYENKKVYEVCFKLNSDDRNVVIYLYNSSKLEQEKYELKYYDYVDLENDANLLHGENNGCNYSALNEILSPKTFITIIIIASLISIISLSIIVYYVVKKKGIFNKNRNKSDDYEYDFSIKNNDILDEEQEEDDYTDEDNTEEVKEVYDKNPRYQEDIDFDIKPYLIEKGLKTNYQEMDELEKNDVMVYLMLLKHDGIISDEVYNSEVVKLWKKSK